MSDAEIIKCYKEIVAVQQQCIDAQNALIGSLTQQLTLQVLGTVKVGGSEENI